MNVFFRKSISSFKLLMTVIIPGIWFVANISLQQSLMLLLLNILDIFKRTSLLITNNTAQIITKHYRTFYVLTYIKIVIFKLSCSNYTHALFALLRHELLKLTIDVHLSHHLSFSPVYRTRKVQLKTHSVLPNPRNDYKYEH